MSFSLVALSSVDDETGAVKARGPVSPGNGLGKVVLAVREGCDKKI